MRHFGDLSIRHKLTALFMAISGFTALALASPMVIYDVMTFRRAVALNLAVLGDVLAGNSTAALTFRDAEAAHDVLQALRAEPNVTAACIYTTDGKPFAKYARDPKDALQLGCPDGRADKDTLIGDVDRCDEAAPGSGAEDRGGDRCEQ